VASKASRNRGGLGVGSRTPKTLSWRASLLRVHMAGSKPVGVGRHGPADELPHDVGYSRLRPRFWCGRNRS